MRERTVERMNHDDVGAAHGAHERIRRARAKCPSVELRHLLIAAAAAIPAGRNWWVERPESPGRVVRA